MKSLLPLLFADGHFIKLDEMNDYQMETFITFLVRCTSEPNKIGDEMKEPPWWLPDLPFVYPIKRPRKVTRKWHHKLKSLIKLCYKYYNHDIMIDFSGELAVYQRQNNIKFVPKDANTTDVLNKRSKKIIATLQNENILYDQTMHTTPITPVTYTELHIDPNNTKPLTQNDFLQYFELNNKDTNHSSMIVLNARDNAVNRINFLNAPYIPFSSQLGRRLATKVKYFVQDATHVKRLERLSRYLNTPPLPTPKDPVYKETHNFNKFFQQWHHRYKFPGKTYASQRNCSMRTNLLQLKCRPCYVKLNVKPETCETICDLHPDHCSIENQPQNSSREDHQDDLNHFCDKDTQNQENHVHLVSLTSNCNNMKSLRKRKSNPVVNTPCSKITRSSSSTTMQDLKIEEPTSSSVQQKTNDDSVSVIPATENALNINEPLRKHCTTRKKKPLRTQLHNTCRTSNGFWAGIVNCHSEKVRISLRLNKRMTRRHTEF